MNPRITDRSLLMALGAGALLLSASCDREAASNEEHAHAEHAEHEGAKSEGAKSEGAEAHAHHDHHEAQAPDPDAIPEDQSGQGLTRQGEFFVTYAPEPNPIPFQKHFTMRLTVHDPEARDEPLEGATIDQVRAIMPAHDHGMKVTPKIEPAGPGAFLVKGMRFHMQGPGEDGKWVLEAVVNHEGTIDTTNFELQCCR